MSCDYANGLSPYAHKGILGAPEKFDSPSKVREKCSMLSQLIKNASHVVVHTGAGISTSAGIPDFRGPNGVWTLEERGKRPDMNVSFSDAKPTRTHMALKKMIDENLVQYVVTQNIDGLHLKSGVDRSKMAELHGNMFVDQCNTCKRQFTRQSPTPTVGQKYVGSSCPSERTTSRPCRGKLHDTILDWEHSLPDDDLEMADMHSSVADLSICLGTTLQIVPSGNLPLNTLRYGGKLVICNLQPTKHDNKADLIINTYVDDVMKYIMEDLNHSIPEYDIGDDPTASKNSSDWTISKVQLRNAKTLYKSKCNGVAKKRTLVKTKQKEPKDGTVKGKRGRPKRCKTDIQVQEDVQLNEEKLESKDNVTDVVKKEVLSDQKDVQLKKEHFGSEDSFTDVVKKEILKDHIENELLAQ